MTGEAVTAWGCAVYNARAEVTRRILLGKGELSTGAYDIVVSGKADCLR